METTSLTFSIVLNLVFWEPHLTVPRGLVGRKQSDTSPEMDEWILVASSALRFFQVYAINYQKKTPDSQLGLQKLQGAHSKIKSHFRFQDLAKMIPNHIRSK